jgi:hypothetical protein
MTKGRVTHPSCFCEEGCSKFFPPGSVGSSELQSPIVSLGTVAHTVVMPPYQGGYIAAHGQDILE